LRGYLDRIVIRDAKSDKVVFGRKRNLDKTIWLPVRSSRDAKPVAFFGFEPSSRLDSQFDRVFAKQQQQQLLTIGLFGVLVAAALAIPFSGWLVRPIQQLTQAVRTMTQGDLTVSVKADRNDELGQLGRDFNHLAEVLMKNSQDRQQWVSDIAHELRTPIAVFMADIEAAQDGVRTVDEAWLAMMHQHVSRLTRLVNDLHQLSQSDSGTLSYRFEELNLVDVINNAVQQFKQSCQDCYIDAHWQAPVEPVLMLADDSRLNQLFSNLAQNTLRYTDGDPGRHGHLRIRIESRGNEVDVIWEDSSPGVGDGDLSKLFDRLYRVDESRSRESGGSGLGLAIVKNIIEAHQGSIRAQHSDLGGLKVIVTFKTNGR
jgi:two-component system sensor histidine kinase BaeS